jgi:hypothetical protein
MSSFIVPPFSKDTPNKIGEGINISGKNTLTKTVDDSGYRVAIASLSPTNQSMRKSMEKRCSVFASMMRDRIRG